MFFEVFVGPNILTQLASFYSSCQKLWTVFLQEKKKPKDLKL